MKLTIGILACLAIAGVSAFSIHTNTSPVDQAFLAKQKFLFEIVYRVEDPLQFEEYVKLGGNLITDQFKYEMYDDRMITFYESYKVGGILAKGEFFSGIQKYHFFHAWGLFNFFYYAKDYETFVHNVAWARLNVNEGMFVYALTLAVIHRPDMEGLVLPSIYEIMPQMFFNSKFILHAEKFDSDVWNRQIMLEKELKTIYHQEFATEVFGNHFYLKDWKVWQWWKLMGLDEDFRLEETTLFRDNIATFKNDPKYKDVLAGVKAYWMPVDYTRDIEIFNEETKLSYFTEDIGLNAYWYYFNMYYPRFLNSKLFNFNKDRRGELWIYNVQQLLARYYMERLSQGLGEVDYLKYDGVVKAGYDPQLIAYNGNGFTFRKNYYELESHQDEELVTMLKNIDRRMQDVIDFGKYVTVDGVVIDLRKPDAIEYIGDIMQGNLDIIDRKFFGYWFSFAIASVTGQDYTSHNIVPHVVHNFETMLRDPITYHIFKRISGVVDKYELRVPPYTRKELIVPGVKIVNVEVSKLKTFFDLVDVDVTNLLNEKMVFHDGKFVWDTTLLGRQARLNHKVFNINFNVTSEEKKKVIVRTFLAPDFDEFGQKIDILLNRENFFELDEFVYELVPGVNVFDRSSKDFFYTINDQTTYTELYKYVMLAYEGKQEYPTEIVQPQYGFPNRLLLPHGWVKGLPMKMFFVISPFTGTQEQFTQFGQVFGVHDIDTTSYGYPFDRRIENYYEFLVPNMFVKDVKIYHTEKYDKYYPQRYEHYGTFDYTY